MKLNADMKEYEQQRYDEIKKKGKYLELNILIGVEPDELNETSHTKVPIITNTLCGCGSEEIGCLYMTLKELINHYEKKFPFECLLSRLTANVTDLGSVDIPIEHDEEE